jgi:hypothetical protein
MKASFRDYSSIWLMKTFLQYRLYQTLHAAYSMPTIKACIIGVIIFSLWRKAYGNVCHINNHHTKLGTMALQCQCMWLGKSREADSHFMLLFEHFCIPGTVTYFEIRL